MSKYLVAVITVYAFLTSACTTLYYGRDIASTDHESLKGLICSVDHINADHGLAEVFHMQKMAMTDVTDAKYHSQDHSAAMFYVDKDHNAKFITDVEMLNASALYSRIKGLRLVRIAEDDPGLVSITIGQADHESDVSDVIAGGRGVKVGNALASGQVAMESHGLSVGCAFTKDPKTKAMVRSQASE